MGKLDRIVAKYGKARIETVPCILIDGVVCPGDEHRQEVIDRG